MAIFLVSTCSLAFYGSRMLLKNTEQMLGAQQLSTAAFVAAEINSELANRFKALETIAAQVTPDIMNNAASVQTLLEQRPLLQILFNGGNFVTGVDGTAKASLPLSVGRVGVNYMDRDFIIAAIREGKATVGRPVMGKKLNSPIFVMATPIRDAKSRVIGVIAGVTDLGKANFLDRISETHYGKTGGYLIVAKQYRLIVNATDKSRVMASLPPPGIIPMIDRFISGYEGTLRYVNPLGIDQLASVKSIPLAGWYVNVTLPIAEAFAPIRAMQQRILLGTIMFTLLAGTLIWLISWQVLRRMFSPMLAASRTLATLSGLGNTPQPLPITNQDEIGELIGSFNGLLEILGKRESELNAKNSEMERFAYTVSHDLKSPLITIQAFAGMILKNIETGRYERVRDDMKRIEGAAGKMTDLLNDLLELSRVGRQMNEPSLIDMNRLVSDVLAQLTGVIKQSLVEVVLQPDLPALHGDQKRLAEVLQNLIENAIKYRGEQSAPRIEIGTRQDDSECVFFVSDNGKGIDPRHHERIFGLFNKLDAESEGTGVGLALVRRIIEVHGGRVWVESEGEGMGCTFCFTVGL